MYDDIADVQIWSEKDEKYVSTYIITYLKVV